MAIYEPIPAPLFILMNSSDFDAIRGAGDDDECRRTLGAIAGRIGAEFPSAAPSAGEFILSLARTRRVADLPPWQPVD